MNKLAKHRTDWVGFVNIWDMPYFDFLESLKEMKESIKEENRQEAERIELWKTKNRM